MAIFRCKMCGGNLEMTDGSTVGTCDHCGAKQTLPRVDDEEQRNLFNRANVLRMRAEFDKAEEIYEKIIQANPEEAEAYWGLILCRYGIEYVEDPGTGKRIPTCNRVSYDSVAADEDYKNAVRYADISQKILYEEEAKTIDGIQKGILAVSQKEEPYDVFICYKEKDENGQRTRDSVIGNDIYYQLTNEGFRVFFAAVSLEDKIGKEYEPYIFSALNSARVMLCIGTKPEYFQAAWVRNEWSRYLKLLKKDRSRSLIPCYRDMDAYDLPEELIHLQAQDMSKIGFMTDLIRGIRKLIPKQETVRPGRGAETVSPQAGTLLKRAYICLEDGEWEKANDLAEQLLNANPENAEAYLVQLMSRLHVYRREDLVRQREPFDREKEYQRIMRYGDEKMKQELQGYNRTIEQRNREESNNNILREAYMLVHNGKTAADVYKAIEMLGQIRGWKNADSLAEEAKEKAETLQKDGVYQRGTNLMNAANYEMAIECFGRIPGWRDADELLLKCREEKDAIEKEQERQKTAALDASYEEAVRLMNSDDIGQLEMGVIKFEQLAGWRDSAEKLYYCQQKLNWARTNAANQENERQRQYQAYYAGEQEKYRRLQSELEHVESQINKLSGQKAISGMWKTISKCAAIFCTIFLISSIVSTLSMPAEGLASSIAATLIVAVAAFLFWLPTINAKKRTRKVKEYENDRKQIKEEMAAAGAPLSYEDFIRQYHLIN